DRDLVDGIDDLHAVHHTPKGGIGTVQMVRTRGGHYNKELIGGCEFMGVVPFTAGHGDGAPVVAMPLSGIGGKQIPAYVRPFFHDLGIVGAAPLNDEILDHPMELRTVKIMFLCQIDEVGLVVGYIVIELRGETVHGWFDSHAVSF